MSFNTPADFDELCSHGKKVYIIAETMQYSVMHSHLVAELTVLKRPLRTRLCQSIPHAGDIQVHQRSYICI